MSNKEGPDLSANHINHEESRFVRRTAEISNANRVSKPDGRLIPGQLTMCDHTQPIFIDRSERPRWHQGQRRRSRHKLSTINNHPAIALHTVRGSDIEPLYVKKNQFSVKKGQNRMKAIIWHNPNCGTSRKTLAILEETDGVELTVIEYLKAAPSVETLRALYKRAGIAARQGLRTKGTAAEELGLLNADDETILQAMADEPILIERPLVETEKGVRLCRPQDVVHEIL